MFNSRFIITITHSAYSYLAATAVSSVVVETDIGTFIINTVTLPCISLDSAVGSASGFWPEGREFESRWDCLLYFFLRTVSVLTKTRNSVCKRAYGTTGRPTACLNSLCSLCTACGRAMLFWHFRHFDRKWRIKSIKYYHIRDQQVNFSRIRHLTCLVSKILVLAAILIFFLKRGPPYWRKLPTDLADFQ